MYPIDVMARQVPILLNEFFRSFHKSLKPLKVFLCGHRPKNQHFDLRQQVKRLLESRMGCTAFRGEDIQDLRKEVKIKTENVLHIEVREATNSDLIMMFLGSEGTFAELTAFALDPNIRPKLIVFNKQEYKEENSFINLGPIKLLNPERVIYYDGNIQSPSINLIVELDKIVARVWYEQTDPACLILPEISFETFASLALIYSSYPIRYSELLSYFPWSERIFKSTLKILTDNKLVRVREKKYIPTVHLDDLGIAPPCTEDIARARMSMMGKRLRSSETATDYRLIVS